MTAGLVTELKKNAELVKESQLKQTYKDPRQKEIGHLLPEAGEEGSENCSKEDGAGGVD